MADFSMIVNLHREGRLAHPSLRSLAEACRAAALDGIDVEVVLVLDRADDLTRSIVAMSTTEGGPLGEVVSRVLEVDNGDPGLSRNDGVRAATAPFIGTFDADNLVSRNWIAEAYRTLRSTDAPTVVHPAFMIAFERDVHIWPVMGSDDPKFRPELMVQLNPWDAMGAGSLEIYREHPNLRSADGFGYEDWHWNCETVAAGIRHQVVPGTVHYYRIKHTGSVNTSNASRRSLLRPSSLLKSREMATEQAYEPSVPAIGADAPAGLVPVEQGSTVAARLWKAAALDDVPLRPDGAIALGRIDGLRLLLPESRDALRPDRINLAHYRILNPDLDGLSGRQLIKHYLEFGRREGRPTLLDGFMLDLLERVDFCPERYGLGWPDLDGLHPVQLIRHFFEYGLYEGRHARMRSARSVRESFGEAGEIPEVVLRDWEAVHDIEPAIPYPSPGFIANLPWSGHYRDVPDESPTRAWWELVAKLPDRIDALFLAPWVKMGGGDVVLLRYLELVRRERPDWSVVLITTEPETSTRLDRVPPGVVTIDLASIFENVDHLWREQLVATLLVQFAPELVHVFNSPIGFDAVEDFGTQIAHQSRIFLSTFVVERTPDGTIHSPLLRRSPTFLEPVRSVITDQHGIVHTIRQFTAAPPEKFVVHHQAVDMTPVHRTEPVRTRKIFWAARFDRQKRLDVLADVAEALSEAGLDVEVHFYGDSVMADRETSTHLERLAKAGAVQHPPYAHGLEELPLEDYALFLMTSEREGIPLLLLDVVARGVPVVAPAVGGIPDVITPATGRLITSTTAIEEYVLAIKEALADPDDTQRRAEAARAYVASEFSRQAWEARVRATPGYLDDDGVAVRP